MQWCGTLGMALGVSLGFHALVLTLLPYLGHSSTRETSPRSEVDTEIASTVLVDLSNDDDLAGVDDLAADRSAVLSSPSPSHPSPVVAVVAVVAQPQMVPAKVPIVTSSPRPTFSPESLIFSAFDHPLPSLVSTANALEETVALAERISQSQVVTSEGEPVAATNVAGALQSEGESSTSSGRGTGADSGPAYHSNPLPRYPAEARRLRHEGIVKLRVSVSAQGQPENVGITDSSGHSELDAAALRTVSLWRFRPAKQQGRSVACNVVVPVRFALENGVALVGK